MQLVANTTLPESRHEAMRKEFLAVRELLFAYRPTDGRGKVDELLARRGDSPVGQIASDLLESAVAMGKQVTERQIWQPDKAARLEGAPAPEFSGTDLDGNPVRLAELRGKLVLLNFWASS